MCFDSKDEKSTVQTQYPSYITDALQKSFATAQSAAGTAYQPYGGQQVAPFSNLQLSAFGSLPDAASAANPYINAATGLVGGATQPVSQTPWSPEEIAKYSSPYTQSVIDATQNQFNLQNAQQQTALTGNAASQHALGGDRSAVAAAQLAGQQQTAQAPVIAGLNDKNFQQATQEFNTQQQTDLATQQANRYIGLYGAGELGNLGQMAQGTGLAGAGALLQAGGLQQQQAQNYLNVPYQNYQTAQQWPFYTSQFLSSATTGAANPYSNNKVSTTPGPSLAGQIAGLGTTFAGLGGFSSNPDLPLGGLINWKRGGAIEGMARGGGLRAYADGGTTIGGTYIPGLGASHKKLNPTGYDTDFINIPPPNLSVQQNGAALAPTVYPLGGGSVPSGSIAMGGGAPGGGGGIDGTNPTIGGGIGGSGYGDAQFATMGFNSPTSSGGSYGQGDGLSPNSYSIDPSTGQMRTLINLGSHALPPGMSLIPGLGLGAYDAAYGIKPPTGDRKGILGSILDLADPSNASVGERAGYWLANQAGIGPGPLPPTKDVLNAPSTPGTARDTTYESAHQGLSDPYNNTVQGILDSLNRLNSAAATELPPLVENGWSDHTSGSGVDISNPYSMTGNMWTDFMQGATFGGGRFDDSRSNPYSSNYSGGMGGASITGGGGWGKFDNGATLNNGGNGEKRGGGIKAFADGGFDDEYDTPDDSWLMQDDEPSEGQSPLTQNTAMLAQMGGLRQPTVGQGGGEGRIDYEGNPLPPDNLDPEGNPAGSYGLAAAAPRAPVRRPSGGIDAAHQGLIAAGLGMMSAKGNFLSGVGQGGLTGLGAYQKAKTEERQQQALEETASYRSAMSQAALQRSEALAQHYNNVDKKPQFDRTGKTLRIYHPDSGEMVDTHLPNDVVLNAAERNRIAKQSADNAGRPSYQWQSGTQGGVSGVFKLPTHGGDGQPTFIPGSELTGKGGRGGAGATQQLIAQLMDPKAMNGHQAKTPQEALAMIHDPSEKNKNALGAAMERLASAAAKVDPDFADAPAAVMTKWREYYGLGQVGAAPTGGVQPPAPAVAPAKPAGVPPGAQYSPSQGKYWWKNGSGAWQHN